MDVLVAIFQLHWIGFFKTVQPKFLFIVTLNNSLVEIKAYEGNSVGKRLPKIAKRYKLGFLARFDSAL